MNMVTVFLIGFLMLVEASPPPFPHLGCPNNGVLLDCPQRDTSCVPIPKRFPFQFKHRHRGSIYRKIRARSWWFCGKACDPTTPCKFWTYRHATRECYLMKSCCASFGDKAFQSGTDKCPTDS